MNYECQKKARLQLFLKQETVMYNLYPHIPKHSPLPVKSFGPYSTQQLTEYGAGILWCPNTK